jgi:(p)ppGpp synthase/HD superfamily hydrolase
MAWNIDKFAAAWEFATLRHLGQTYGGRREGEHIPYINHLASVATEVLWAIGAEPGWDADFAIQCALLHDVIEDTGTSFDTVASEFGIRVAQGVAALTKDSSIASPIAKMDDSLRRIRQQDKEVWVVKLADRISNLNHPPFYWDRRKIEQYREEAQRILAALGPANKKMADRLAKKISGYPNAA